MPVAPERSVCTMRWGSHLIPGMPRTLAGACAHVGVELRNHHSALVDAEAAAGLLRFMLGEVGPRAVPWRDLCATAERAPWPVIPGGRCGCVRRGNATERAVPYLARLVDSLPEPCGAAAEADYLALLDRALLDRFLSVREQAALVAAAVELGIDQPTAMGLHRAYLAALARAALADGVVTPAEREDLDAVAHLLDLDPAEVDAALAGGPGGDAGVGGFRLDPGDMVVFTGEMAEPRSVWEQRAEAAGLVPWRSVTKKVKLVVAADPDSLSGKARKAADYGIPIVTEDAFAAMLQRLRNV
ncbi:MAG: DNA polymerase III subunit epsilon [Actinomycetes bacterium]|nr:DNA polymerase III subunit epsilon [Actinomycetes bacterium]